MENKSRAIQFDWHWKSNYTVVQLMVVMYYRPYKIFHENNFFEEGIDYTICIDGNRVNATGKLTTHCCVSDVPHFHISHSHEYTLSSDVIRKESVSFDM